MLFSRKWGEAAENEGRGWLDAYIFLDYRSVQLLNNWSQHLFIVEDLEALIVHKCPSCCGCIPR
jgi:hypothetical protein